MSHNLIKSGYATCYKDIGNMTERQIILAYESTIRAECRERLNYIIDTNIATVGGKESTNFIKKLEEGCK